MSATAGELEAQALSAALSMGNVCAKGVAVQAGCLAARLEGASSSLNIGNPSAQGIAVDFSALNTSVAAVRGAVDVGNPCLIGAALSLTALTAEACAASGRLDICNGSATGLTLQKRALEAKVKLADLSLSVGTLSASGVKVGLSAMNVSTGVDLAGTLLTAKAVGADSSLKFGNASAGSQSLDALKAEAIGAQAGIQLGLEAPASARVLAAAAFGFVVKFKVLPIGFQVPFAFPVGIDLFNTPATEDAPDGAGKSASGTKQDGAGQGQGQKAPAADATSSETPSESAAEGQGLNPAPRDKHTAKCNPNGKAKAPKGSSEAHDQDDEPAPKSKPAAKPGPDEGKLDTPAPNSKAKSKADSAPPTSDPNSLAQKQSALFDDQHAAAQEGTKTKEADCSGVWSHKTEKAQGQGHQKADANVVDNGHAPVPSGEGPLGSSIYCCNQKVPAIPGGSVEERTVEHRAQGAAAPSASPPVDASSSSAAEPKVPTAPAAGPVQKGPGAKAKQQAKPPVAPKKTREQEKKEKLQKKQEQASKGKEGQERKVTIDLINAATAPPKDPSLQPDGIVCGVKVSSDQSKNSSGDQLAGYVQASVFEKGEYKGRIDCSDHGTAHHHPKPHFHDDVGVDKSAQKLSAQQQLRLVQAGIRQTGTVFKSTTKSRAVTLPPPLENGLFEPAAKGSDPCPWQKREKSINTRVGQPVFVLVPPSSERQRQAPDKLAGPQAPANAPSNGPASSPKLPLGPKNTAPPKSALCYSPASSHSAANSTPTAAALSSVEAPSAVLLQPPPKSAPIFLSDLHFNKTSFALRAQDFGAPRSETVDEFSDGHSRLETIVETDPDSLPQVPCCSLQDCETLVARPTPAGASPHTPVLRVPFPEESSEEECGAEMMSHTAIDRVVRAVEPSRSCGRVCVAIDRSACLEKHQATVAVLYGCLSRHWHARLVVTGDVSLSEPLEVHSTVASPGGLSVTAAALACGRRCVSQCQPCEPVLEPCEVVVGLTTRSILNRVAFTSDTDARHTVLVDLEAAVDYEAVVTKVLALLPPAGQGGSSSSLSPLGHTFCVPSDLEISEFVSIAQGSRPTPRPAAVYRANLQERTLSTPAVRLVECLEVPDFPQAADLWKTLTPAELPHVQDLRCTGFSSCRPSSQGSEPTTEGLIRYCSEKSSDIFETPALGPLYQYSVCLLVDVQGPKTPRFVELCFGLVNWLLERNMQVTCICFDQRLSMIKSSSVSWDDRTKARFLTLMMSKPRPDAESRAPKSAVRAAVSAARELVAGPNCKILLLTSDPTHYPPGSPLPEYNGTNCWVLSTHPCQACAANVFAQVAVYRGQMESLISAIFGSTQLDPKPLPLADGSCRDIGRFPPLARTGRDVSGLHPSLHGRYFTRLLDYVLPAIVSGRAFDSRTGEVLVDVVVALVCDGRRVAVATTGDSGSYSLSAAPGEYRVSFVKEPLYLEAWHTGEGADSTPLQVRADEVIGGVDGYLERNTAVVAGCVCDSEGSALAGARVVVLSRAHKARQEVWTREDGSFSAEVLGNSMFTVQASKQGYLSKSDGPFRLSSGDCDRSLKILLRRDLVTVVGVVRCNGAALPLSGVSVEVGADRLCVTDSDGQFRVNVQAGSQLLLRRPGFKALKAHVPARHVSGKISREVLCEMEPIFAMVHGTVVDAALADGKGARVGGVAVALQSADGRFIVTASTDSEGCFTLQVPHEVELVATMTHSMYHCAVVPIEALCPTEFRPLRTLMVARDGIVSGTAKCGYSKSVLEGVCARAVAVETNKVLAQVFTDVYGRYTLTVPSRIPFAVCLSCEDYLPACTEAVALSSNTAMEQGDVAMQPVLVNVKGFVYDAESGDTIQDALVTVHDASEEAASDSGADGILGSFRSDGDGFYEFWLPQNVYSLKCSHPKFYPEAYREKGGSPLAWVRAPLFCAHFALHKRDGMLSGRVLDRESGAALPGAEVLVLLGPGHEAAYRAAADEHGGFAVAVRPREDYRLLFRRALYQPCFNGSAETAEAAPPIAVDAGSELAGIDGLLLQEDGRVCGRIRDAETGALLEGAEIKLYASSEGAPAPLLCQQPALLLAAVESGDAGLFIMAVRPGAWRLEFHFPGYESEQAWVAVGPGQAVDASAELRQLDGYLEGQVTDRETTAPIAGATVRVLQADRTVGTAVTCSRGLYSVRLRPAASLVVRFEGCSGYHDGHYNIVAASPGSTERCARPEPDPICLRGNETRGGIDGTLVQKRGYVEGTVRDRDTLAVLGNVRVLVMRGDAVVATVSSDDDGRFRAAVRSGTYTVCFQRSQYKDGYHGADDDRKEGAALVAVVPAKTSRGVNGTIMQEDGVLCGFVADAYFLTPVANCRALALSQPGELNARVDGDTQGRFSLTVRPGTYKVKLSGLPDYLSGYYHSDGSTPPRFEDGATVTVRPGQTVSGLSAHLQGREGRISGVVSGQSGAGLRCATVTLMHRGKACGKAAQTDGRGWYSIAAWPGEYVVQFEHPAHETQFFRGAASASAASAVRLPANGACPGVDARLREKEAVVCGRVRELGTWTYLDGATVTLSNGGSATSDSGGSFRLTTRSGQLSVSVSKPGYEAWSHQDHIAAGETRTLDAQLKKVPAPPPPPPPSGGGKKSGCFAGPAAVRVWRGGGGCGGVELIPISALQAGMRVEAADGTYETVLGFLHRDPAAEADFVAVSVDGARTALRVSGRHLVLTRDRGYAAARELRPGADRVLHEGQWAAVATVATIRAAPRGVYAPLTWSGRLVVEGVEASCYSDIRSHVLAHWALFPLRCWLLACWAAGRAGVGPVQGGPLAVVVNLDEAAWVRAAKACLPWLFSRA